MDYEKFGICITIVIVTCLCGFAGIAAGGIDLGISSNDHKIPFPTSSTKTDNNTFYEYCYKFNIDNC